MSSNPLLTSDQWIWLSTSGDERTRTADPLLAKQVLYQLSYVPLFTFGTLSHDLAHGFFSPK